MALVGFIVAAELDTGESVAFGAPGVDHVPISRAVQASSALPGLFPPVDIGGHFFVDGALRKTLLLVVLRKCLCSRAAGVLRAAAAVTSLDAGASG